MFEEHLQSTLYFLKTNPIVAVVIGIVLVFCFYSKPKEMFKLVVFCLFVAVAFYFITMMAGVIGSGAQSKDEMIYKSKKLADE